MSDEAARVTYELLRCHGDLTNAETHKELLRTLSSVRVDRSSAEVLQRLHATEFALIRGEPTEHQVSNRRKEIREKWRLRQTQEGATLEDVQRRFPKLFEGEVKEKTELKKAPTESTSGTDITQQLRIPPAPVAAPMKEAKATSKNDFTFHDDVWSGPPQAAAVSTPKEPPTLQPKPALSDLLSKRSRLPHEDPELFGSDTRPSPVQQQNPFQTATERLQHDRMTGRARNLDDNQPGSRSERQRNPRGPPRGTYHPVNQDLLLGGGENDGYVSRSSALSKKFVSPMSGNKSNMQTALPDEDDNIDPRIKSCDPELIEKIEMEIVDNGDPITFDDIAGLQFAKKCVNELVIWPMARPDIFNGLRSLPKGLLLFGPPGRGKTLIGKAIASLWGDIFQHLGQLPYKQMGLKNTKACILLGKEKARSNIIRRCSSEVKQPSVIFIDEIDSLLTQRSSEENEASRRMKTEFLVQLDTKAKDIILVVGATNRPQELDEAARRGFVKRFYIPLSLFEARLDLVSRLLKDNKNELNDENKAFIADSTKGYSGADVRAFCTEVAMGPIRSCSDIRTVDADSIRPINMDDFKEALRGCGDKRPRVLQGVEKFGSFAFEGHESS